MGVYLPTVDFSPMSQAIQGRGAAGQANFSDDFAKLRKKERTRQAVFGAIQGAFEVASSVYGILEQSKMEVGKQDAIRFQSGYRKAIEESILNGSSTIVEEDGRQIIQLDPSLQAYYDQETERITKNYSGFGRVQNWLKTQATQAQAESSSWANSVLLDRGMKEAQDAFNQNVSQAMKASIDTEDVTPVLDMIETNSLLTPNGVKALSARAQEAYGLGVAENRAIGAAKAGGLSAGIAAIEGTSFAEDEKVALRASVAKSVQAQELAAFDAASQAYEATKQEATKQGDYFLADTAIKNISSQSPEWMRPSVEEGLRKIQTQDNLAAGITQFNKDRDNPSLTYLKKQYESTQNSPGYLGDEKTRSTVMSWYEGLIGRLEADKGGGDGADKEGRKSALSILDSATNLFVQGAGGMSGYQVLEMVDNFKNGVTMTEKDGTTTFLQISATEANTARDRIIKHQFPQAAEFLDKKEAYVKSILGIKRADKDMTPDERVRVMTTATVLSEKVADRLMEEGGTITPEKVAQIFEEARQVVTSKALDDMKVGFNLFESSETTIEKAYATTKAAIDSPAGVAAVFTDRSGKLQFLSDQPEQLKATIEKAAEYERGRLADRGVNIVTESYEPEGLYDVTGSKIYTGSDGMQYRMRSEGKKGIIYTRGSAQADWRVLPDAAAPASSYVSPANPRAGTQATSGSKSVTRAPITEEEHKAIVAAKEEAEKKRREQIIAAAKKETARPGRR